MATAVAVGTVTVAVKDPRLAKIAARYHASFDREDWVGCWEAAEAAIREWTWRGKQVHRLHEGGLIDTRDGSPLGDRTAFCTAQRGAWVQVQAGLQARFPQDECFF